MKRTRRGALVVEFTLVILAAAVGLAASVVLIQVDRVRRRAHQAARLAALLASSGAVTWGEAEKEARSYWRDTGGGRAEIVVRRFDDTPAARFYSLVAAEARVEIRLPFVGASSIVTERVVAAQED